MLMVKLTTSVFDRFKTSLTSLFLLLSIILVITPGELFSQSNSYTTTQIQQIEQNVLESLIDENHQEFIRHLEELRAKGIAVHHELLYHEAEAHYRLSNFTDAQLAIGFYLDHDDGELNQQRNAEALSAQLEVEMQEMWEEEEQLFQRAVQDRQLRDVNQYLDQFPDGRYATEMREMYDDYSFEQAQRTNTRDGFGRYLREFPEGNHREKAQIRYDQLERLNVLNRQENQLSTLLRQNEAQRNQYRNRSIMWGSLAVGSGIGAFLVDRKDRRENNEEENVFLGILGVGMFAGAFFSFENIRKTVRMNRNVTENRQNLLDVRNEKEQLRNSISLSPHINPLEGKYALSFQMRF